MPASEETYRSVRGLHVAFAVTSLAMMAVVVWMILADHLRPWKQYQREFQQIETDKLVAQKNEALAKQQREHQAEIQALVERRKAAETRAGENARQARDLAASIDSTRGEFQQVDQKKRFQKAELDSLRSFYDGMIDRDERREAARFLVESIRPAEQSFAKVSRDYDAVSLELRSLELRRGLLQANVVEVAADPPAGTDAAEAGFKAGDELTVADFQALYDRVVPILLGRDAAERVEAVVRRAGKDETLAAQVEPLQSPGRPAGEDEAWAAFGLAVTPLTPEVLSKRIDDLKGDVDRIDRTLATKEAQYGTGEGLGGLWNRGMALVRNLPVLDLAAPPVKIQQITLPELTINYNFKDVPRFDRCMTCHLGIDRVGYDTMADGRTPMASVFHSHPHLTDGATTVDPKGKVVNAGLYLDSNGPHPVNSFGCTICHGGQGSGTTFTYASHEPNDLEQREQWEKDLAWHEMHHWDFPMLPARFTESSCLKCHHQVTDLKEHQAPKLLAGYRRITKFGCTGCHTIGGEGAFGPDLTDARQVGPNLKHVGSKVGRDWLVKWLKNPHAFRPDSRMPRFYGVTNNDKPEDWPKNHAEIHSIAHYLFTTSTEPEGFDDPPAQSDPARGKTLFLEKGCMACHADRPYTAADLPESLGDALSDAYDVKADDTYPPEAFPEEARKYADADFGPNLSSMAAKFPSKEKGYRWLANWIKDPGAYHPKTLMPNLQLSAQDAADIASWVVSTREDWGDGSDARFWPLAVDVPPVDSPEVAEGLDELVSLYLSKSKVYKERTILLSEVDSIVAQMGRDEKLMYVGERTISRLGCFGCHNIHGFEGAKPIGTPLNGWGYKSPTRLDFAHINEFLADQPLGEEQSRDGTPEYYQEKLGEHNRMGFLYQKLHRPRSYDYKKDRPDILAWDERLRMPQFSWADDPAAVEEVMTFVLGLTGEKIAARYLPRYDPPTEALAKGERLLDRYNCRGCHTLAMPRYTIAEGTDLDRVFKFFEDPPFEKTAQDSYNKRANDYTQLYPGIGYQPDGKPNLGPREPGPITIEGMPIFLDVSEDDQGRPVKTLTVELWQPVTVRGYTFRVGDRVQIDPDQVAETPAEGGNFAWLFSSYQAAQTGEPLPTFWNTLPPPLIREGEKVQTPWLTNFLQDPYKIRPAAQLRMPRFHYGATPAEVAAAMSAASEGEPPREGTLGETRDLANYFAARDGAVFPYQEVPQRDQGYLSGREKLFNPEAGTDGAAPKYLEAGWTLITKNQCVQCHAIGQFQPTGEPKTHGPNLRQVPDRIRPEYMLKWIANPPRMIPYTAMPQVFPPHPAEGTPPLPGVPGELEGQPLEQVRTIRDTLLNFVSAVERQLAAVAPPPQPAPAEGQAPASPAPGEPAAGGEKAGAE
jgi:cytochrome c551/c552